MFYKMNKLKLNVFNVAIFFLILYKHQTSREKTIWTSIWKPRL